MGIKNYVFSAADYLAWYHPGRSAVILVNGREVGTIGEIHPLVLENYGIDQKTTAFLLDLHLLAEKTVEAVNYRPLPRYPAVSRDLAVIVPEQVETSEVIRIIRNTREALLQEVRLFDLYRGKQIEAGYKSMAFSLTWQAEDRTLTDEEVRILHEDILVDLAKMVGAEIRV